MGVRISQLPSATTPTGTEIIPIVQAGVTKQFPIAGSTGSGLVGFQQSGTGAGTRTLQSKVREVASVTDFTDGLGNFASTSASAAVNTAAFNAALAAHSVVFVPGEPGDIYDLNSLTALTTSKILWGNGAALRFNTTGDGITFSQVASAQNIIGRIVGLTFLNTGSTPASFIKNNGCLNFLVEKCRFSNCAATYCVDNLKGYGTQLRDCVFSDVTGKAVRLRDDGAVNFYSYVFGIDNCDFTRVSGDNITVETANVLKITKTTIETSGAKGIVTSTNGVGLGAQLIFDSCYFENNAGISVDLGTNGTTYWGRATFIATWFNGSASVALGAKSKAIFIGIQGNGGSTLTVTGSANAEVQVIGSESANIIQSGTFNWTALDLGALVLGGTLTTSKDSTQASNLSGGILVQNKTTPASLLNIGYDGALNVGFIQAVTNGVTTRGLNLNPNGGFTSVGAQFLEKQGAVVASANTLILGADGNRFQISGATQINLIDVGTTVWTGASIITLHFQSTPTVKHNQVVSGNNKPIMLAGSVDFIAAANSRLVLQYDSIDAKWYEIARTVA